MSPKNQYQWEVLRQSSRLFRKYWLLFARTALVFLIPFCLIDRYFWNNFLLRQDIIFGYSFDVYYLLYLAIAVFVWLFFFWYLASLIKCIESADGHKPLGVLQSYKQSLPLLKGYVCGKCFYLMKVFLRNFFKCVKQLVPVFMLLFALCAPCIIILDILMYFLYSAGYFLITLWIDYVEMGILASGSIFMVIFGYYLYKNLGGMKNGQEYSS